MNEHITNIGRYGLKLIASFEGEPRLKARKCEGGRYELSYGCTTWTDGRPIGPADVCTKDQALRLFDYHLDRFEATVRRLVTVELTQMQFDALVSLAYNIGEGRFATSTVLKKVNAREWEDAAAAFGLYVFATSDGPSLTQAKDKALQAIIGKDAKGEACWIGQSGQPCDYQQAFMGLKRRHDSEGLLFLGLPWEEPCHQDRFFLHAERRWDAGQGRWEDTVLECTDFSTVKARALLIGPLDPSEAVQKPVPAVAPAPPPAGKSPQAAKPAPYRPPLPQGPMTPIPPAAKPLEQTRRAWGAFIYYGGKIFMAFGVSTLPGHLAIWFGEAWGAVVKDPVLFGLAIDTLVFSSGWVMDHCGAWIRKRGERHAKSVIVSGGETPAAPAPVLLKEAA